LVDIGRLTVEEDLYLYIIGMETLFAGKVWVSVITDLFKGIKGDMFILFGAELNIGGNFPSDNDMFPATKTSPLHGFGLMMRRSTILSAMISAHLSGWREMTSR
jgi:hypothetical protein